MATSMSALMGGGVKSIQRGVISLGAAASRTANISPVNTSKTELRFLGLSAGFTYFYATALLKLTNSTTITATKFNEEDSVTVVSWELTEWY